MAFPVGLCVKAKFSAALGLTVPPTKSQSPQRNTKNYFSQKREVSKCLPAQRILANRANTQAEIIQNLITKGIQTAYKKEVTPIGVTPLHVSHLCEQGGGCPGNYKFLILYFELSLKLKQSALIQSLRTPCTQFKIQNSSFKINVFSLYTYVRLLSSP